MEREENFIHVPEVKTTPETILEKEGVLEAAKEVGPLSPEELEARVNELAELSAARAEAAKHAHQEAGAGSKAELAELRTKGDSALASHLEALELDPELTGFRETALKEYDTRIRKLGSNPEVLEAYKERFQEQKKILAKVLAYEHARDELNAVTSAEQKLAALFEKNSSAPGPIEREKIADLARRKDELGKTVKNFELEPATIDLLRRREIRRMQLDLEKYKFAETESRTTLIRAILPDLLQSAPVLFQGETGSGKSQLAEYIAQRFLGHKVTPISFHEQVKESEVMGRTTLKEGATEFVYSEFVKSMKEGKPVILDEINLIPHEFQGIFNKIFQLRVGDVWTHPTTGERMPIKKGFVVMATANLKSERYKQRYELDVATIRRFIGGAGAREIHYLDLGKKNKEGQYIAPETLQILTAVLADRRGNIQWNATEAAQKVDELKRFVAACRKIQEDFTLSIKEGTEESLAKSDRLAFREMVITLKDQIEIMKAWEVNGFREPLDQVVLREFFHKAEISGRPAKDRENMIRVFMGNKFFQDTAPEDFKVPGLSAKTVRAWQGKE